MRFAAGLRCVAAVLCVLAQVLAASCRSPGALPARDPVSEWLEGPVRWLLLPDEERQLRRVQSDAELEAFVRGFWYRRDPDPRRRENAFAEEFFKRVADADRLYPEGVLRGSLTARGRVLILLGTPTIVRHTRRPAPALDPRRGGHPRLSRPTRLQPVVLWAYPPQDLPPAVRRELAEEGEAELYVTFVLERGGAVLVEGEKFLRLAARSAVRESADP